MDPELPNRAMAAFEHATGLAVCVHDHRRTLWHYLPPDRFYHNNPVCAQLKPTREPACTAFCFTTMRDRASQFRSGVVKRCHAGITELALPVFIDERVEWILFAGVRRAAPGLAFDLDDPNHSGRSGPWAPAVAKLAEITSTTAGHQLEMLRQLAARLVVWRQAQHEDLPVTAAPLSAPPDRRLAILDWLGRHHAEGIQLGDLARHLEVSEDRASHAVKEACGETFVKLLNRMRLRTACGLLRFSDLPLREVARQSGYGNRAHFFAVFKTEMKTTPAAYRRAPITRA